MKNIGEQFLHQKNPSLHLSPEVEHEQERRRTRGEETSQKPSKKIEDWMSLLERTHTSHRDDLAVMERIKAHYRKEYVITPENIPESVYFLEQKIAREQGHGTIEITDEYKEKKNEEIISGQEKSLDAWIDYLTSPDALYPTWAKYWAFRSMLTMGKFEKKEDKETGDETAFFKKRTNDTVAPFPPLNAGALALAIGVMVAKAEENAKEKKDRNDIRNVSVKLNDEEFKELLTAENFSKIYTQFLVELPEYSKKGLEETRGKWVTYQKGSKPDELVKSLEGYPLEWCTRNIDTAKTQLEGGDFHVYYSINEAGEAIIPRVAIRMNDTQIGEVRGIAVNQNMDPYIGDVVKAKLSNFPDGKQYEKKNADMKRMTEIETKGNDLSKEDLRFLYEIDGKVQGFGYQKDPRIDEILNGRNTKEDIALTIGCKKEEVSTTKEEVIKGGIKFHYGSLDLSGLQSAEGLKLPETVNGDLYLSGLQSAEGLKLPETVNGDLYLSGLQSAEGLKLPETVNGDLDLSGLQSAEGLELPETVNGDLYLSGLRPSEKERVRKQYPHLKIY